VTKFQIALITLAMYGIARDVSLDEEGEKGVSVTNTLAELSRQLHADPRAAGLPEDLEGAVEALLVDRATMRAAGETLIAVQNDRANYKRALADAQRESHTLGNRVLDLEAAVACERQRAARAEFERDAMKQRDATHARELKEAHRHAEDHARGEVAAKNRAKALEAEHEQRVSETVEEEREACRDIARSIHQGNTEIPVKDTAAWYACAEFIADEIGRRG
jgi:chromosome segregation ATPase